MKKNILRLLVLACLTLLHTAAFAAKQQHVAPTAEQIRCGGSFHIVEQDGALILNRHSKELFDKEVIINEQKANTPSGIYIEFSTNSTLVECMLKAQDESQGTLRSPVVTIYRNGEPVANRNIKNGLKLENKSGEMTHWKIYMPIMYSLIFEGLNIDQDAFLEPLEPLTRPTYVAIGDSISHGVGQTNLGSDNTYPAILAQQMGWELYNLAVGGSSISPNIASDFSSQQVDVVTILWGYNDWCFRTESYDDIERRYRDLITQIRADHPAAQIYAIMPTYSISTTSRRRSDGETLDELRNIERTVASSLIAQGDSSLHIIDGEELTSAEDLNDNVHLNVDGARRFAERLIEKIK